MHNGWGAFTTPCNFSLSWAEQLPNEAGKEAFYNSQARVFEDIGDIIISTARRMHYKNIEANNITIKMLFQC